MNRTGVDLCEGCVCVENCHSESCEFFSFSDDVDENERKTIEFFFSLHLPKQEDPLDAICNAEKLIELKKKVAGESRGEEVLNSISFPQREGMRRRFCCDTKVLRAF